MKKYSFALALLALATFLIHPLSAEIIYDNSASFENAFNDSRLESGDEVNLAGTARLVTQFQFEYFAEFTTTGDETARVRFYEMNGPAGENDFATPGTLLYDSGAFTITSGYRTVDIKEMNTLLPANKFTWSVEFAGLAAGESAGLLYYNPPSVGSSDAYFWQKENGVWTAVATDGFGNNFGARVTATNAPAGFSISTIDHENGVATATVTGATPARAYGLEYRNTLNAASWQRVAGQVTAAGTSVTLTDPSATVPYRFYRVVQDN